MMRREFIASLGGALAWPLRARAQQPDRVRRIGGLHGVPKEASLGFAAFRQRLGELGYVEGQNCFIDYRWSDQIDGRFTLAAALTELKVDIIVAGEATSAKVAKRATH